jgi:hypothetical protein
MAQYQILYWRYIPLGVKATDLNGTVRENLPSRFQEARDQHVGLYFDVSMERTAGARWERWRSCQGDRCRT